MSDQTNRHADDWYPEHDKLKEINHLSQAIHDFLEWVQGEYHLVLCEPNTVHVSTGCYSPAWKPLMTLLAEHFGIDLKKLEEEKRAMIEALRAANAAAE